jgi:hypothetical protein
MPVARPPSMCTCSTGSHWRAPTEAVSDIRVSLPTEPVRVPEGRGSAGVQLASAPAGHQRTLIDVLSWRAAVEAYSWAGLARHKQLDTCNSKNLLYSPTSSLLLAVSILLYTSCGLFCLAFCFSINSLAQSINLSPRRSRLSALLPLS